MVHLIFVLDRRRWIFVAVAAVVVMLVVDFLPFPSVFVVLFVHVPVLPEFVSNVEYIKK